MKYFAHYIRISIIFFIIFEIFFALTVYFSFNFKLDSLLQEGLIVNIVRCICASLISVGCGMYFSSFIIYHNRQMSVIFFIGVIFGVFSVKGITGSYFLSRFCTPSVFFSSFFIIFSFLISSCLITYSLVCQIRQNIHFSQLSTKDIKQEDNSNSSMFM